MKKKYNKYEVARIIGARSMQISQGAPIYIKPKTKDIIEIALEEFKKGKINITVEE